MTDNLPDAPFEDRLLAELFQILDENSASTLPDNHNHRVRRRVTIRSLALATVVPTICGMVGLGGIELSTGTSSDIAVAAVISRAAAALEPANEIMHVNVSVYGWNLCLGEEMPVRCLDSGPTPAGGLSPNLADDALAYSYQGWSSEAATHVIYSTGDEIATDGQTTTSYDPSNNTLTTVQQPPAAVSPSTPGTVPGPGGLGLAGVPAMTPSDIESLYAQAKNGSAQVQLGSQTTLNGKSVYELDIKQSPLSQQLYVDTQTYLPVEAVVSQTTPQGTLVSQVAKLTSESLPATAANQALLEIGAHSGAAQVDLTQAQVEAQRAAAPHVSVANPTSAQASAASARNRK